MSIRCGNEGLSEMRGRIMAKSLQQDNIHFSGVVQSRGREKL